METKELQLTKQIEEVRLKIQELESVYQQHWHQFEILKTNHDEKTTKKVGAEDTEISPEGSYISDDEIFDIVLTNYNLRNNDYICQQVQSVIDSIQEELEGYERLYQNLRKQLSSMDSIK